MRRFKEGEKRKPPSHQRPLGAAAITSKISSPIPAITVAIRTKWFGCRNYSCYYRYEYNDLFFFSPTPLASLAAKVISCCKFSHKSPLPVPPLASQAFHRLSHFSTPKK